METCISLLSSSFGWQWAVQRERDRQTDRKIGRQAGTETETDRDTDTTTDRQRQRQRDTDRDRQRHRQTETHTHTHTEQGGPAAVQAPYGCCMQSSGRATAALSGGVWGPY